MNNADHQHSDGTSCWRSSLPRHQLKSISGWLQDEIVPKANEIDSNPDALKTALQEMGDRSWLALKVSTKLGGSGLGELDYRLLQVELARASGALTFLQTQHQSAAQMLAKSQNQSLQKLVPDMATGKLLIGVGFSHLRRRGIPMIAATETATGYQITGEVPWITGYNFFDRFILGAALPDGRELYGILPFKNQSQQRSSIIISQPMKLMAIAATNTVSAKITQWHLDSEAVVVIKPSGSIHHSSRNNILHHGWYALGCAYAGLDILSFLAPKKQLDFIQEAWQSLNLEAEQKKAQAINLASNNTPYESRLKLRAQLIDLAQRCSMAAVIASSGAANYFGSNAARVYREALLFSVSGQTTNLMEASLKKLIV